MNITIEIILAIIVSACALNAYSKAKVVMFLRDIEHCPPMFGNVQEVESVYVYTLIVFSNIDLFRIIRHKKQVSWEDWHKFVREKKTVTTPSCLNPLDSVVLKHHELVELLREFRERNF